MAVMGPFRGLLFEWRPSLGKLPQLMAATTILLTNQNLKELHLKPGSMKAIVIIEASRDVEEEADVIISALQPHVGVPVSWDVVDPKADIIR